MTCRLASINSPRQGQCMTERVYCILLLPRCNWPDLIPQVQHTPKHMVRMFDIATKCASKALRTKQKNRSYRNRRYASRAFVCRCGTQESVCRGGNRTIVVVFAAETSLFQLYATKIPLNQGCRIAIRGKSYETTLCGWRHTLTRATIEVYGIRYTFFI